jgi:hypothetical protein
MLSKNLVNTTVIAAAAVATEEISEHEEGSPKVDITG